MRTAPDIQAPGETFNFAQHLLTCNAQRGSKAAFIDDQGVLTYGVLEDRVRRVAASLRALGINTENGDAMLQGMAFDILVTSKDDGSVLRKYNKCSYASGSVQVRKHAIVVSNATFNAIDVSGTGG